jgi:hypothetical protein
MDINKKHMYFVESMNKNYDIINKYEDLLNKNKEIYSEMLKINTKNTI